MNRVGKILMIGKVKLMIFSIPINVFPFSYGHLKVHPNYISTKVIVPDEWGSIKYTCRVECMI